MDWYFLYELKCLNWCFGKTRNIWVNEPTTLKHWNHSSAYPTFKHPRRSSGGWSVFKKWFRICQNMREFVFENSWIFFLINFRYQFLRPIDLYKPSLNLFKEGHFERINQLVLSFLIFQERIHRIEFWVVGRTCIPWRLRGIYWSIGDIALWTWIKV